MVKFYKRTTKGDLFYKEAWLDKKESCIIVHAGKVGFIGKIEKVFNEDAPEFFNNFLKECDKEGYTEIKESEQYSLVIQFPLKSDFGNKRDLWLRDKVQEYVQHHLGWRGLGYVDGYDLGNKKLNIYCFVVDPDKAVTSVKTCLKEYRLDLTYARIAIRKFDQSESEYELKYSHKKVDQFRIF